MSEKHYNAAYLDDTAQILKEIKLNSYKYFSELPEHSAFLDIGCGTGADVINMSTLVKPTCKIIGIDHDPNLIKIAKDSSQAILNVEFLLSEVYNLPYADNSIDGVRAERLIQHLEHSNLLFNEVNRILKLNSRFIVIETDWSSLCFYNGDVIVANKIVDFLTSTKIKNGFASKLTCKYFNQAGFGNLIFELHTLKANRLKDAFAYLWIDKIIEEMKILGILTADEADIFNEQLLNADSRSEFLCSMNIIIGSGQKI